MKPNNLVKMSLDRNVVLIALELIVWLCGGFAAATPVFIREPVSLRSLSMTGQELISQVMLIRPSLETGYRSTPGGKDIAHILNERIMAHDGPAREVAITATTVLGNFIRDRGARHAIYDSLDADNNSHPLAPGFSLMLADLHRMVRAAGITNHDMPLRGTPDHFDGRYDANNPEHREQMTLYTNSMFDGSAKAPNRPTRMDLSLVRGPLGTILSNMASKNQTLQSQAREDALRLTGTIAPTDRHTMADAMVQIAEAFAASNDSSSFNRTLHTMVAVFGDEALQLLAKLQRKFSTPQLSHDFGWALGNLDRTRSKLASDDQ